MGVAMLIKFIIICWCMSSRLVCVAVLRCVSMCAYKLSMCVCMLRCELNIHALCGSRECFHKSEYALKLDVIQQDPQFQYILTNFFSVGLSKMK